MGLLDTARSLFRSPADRRLAAAEKEAWASAPAPATGIVVRAAGGGPPDRHRPPRIDWTRDQPPYPPTTFQFQPGYSDHTYQQFSAPLGFEGFDLERIRNAVAAHRQGAFFETSALMVSVLGFAPVLAALQQAIAPILALPRHVHGGSKGLAKLVASEVAELLVPRSGLLPSPYLPPTLWGTMAILLRMMGFCVLQHIDGDPDPVTGVRPRYTRIWQPWALNWYRSPRKLIALTTEGPVEVRNDGKFTLVADEEEPHLSAAILALGEETLAGKLTQSARQQWLDFFSSPKIYATMPEKTATHSPTGDGFFSAVQTIYGPGGHGVLPYGSKLDAVAIPGEGAGQFKDSLLDAIVHIYMVLTGSAGTIGSGGPNGAGPYQPQKGGPWNVRHDLIARPTIAIVRALNQGVIAPYCDQNYSEAVARAKKAGAWVYPTLEIPIPAPDRDERLAGEVSRYKALTDQVKAEKDAGALVSQERVDALAKTFEVQPFTLAVSTPSAQSYAYDQENGVITIGERRRELGKEPSDRDNLTIPAYRAKLAAEPPVNSERT